MGKFKVKEIPVSEEDRRLGEFCRCRGMDTSYAIQQLISFWETNHRQCVFCQGAIIDGKCTHCGRSDDVDYELRVQMIQKQPHRNWKVYQTLRKVGG